MSQLGITTDLLVKAISVCASDAGEAVTAGQPVTQSGLGCCLTGGVSAGAPISSQCDIATAPTGMAIAGSHDINIRAQRTSATNIAKGMRQLLIVMMID